MSSGGLYQKWPDLALVGTSCLRRVLATRCGGCGRWSTSGICPDCRGELPREVEKNRPGLRAVGRYEGMLRTLIRRFKYGRRPDLALDLGPMLTALDFPPGLVVPVPLSPERQCERGYNQAALLALVLAKEKGWPTWSGLSRCRSTRPQYALPRQARWKNLEGAFRAAPLAGERILLVDDIYTTGATTEAARGALEAAGAGEIWTIVLARTPLTRF